MDPLLDRIAERRAELVEQAERLGKELEQVETELARVKSAEQVVAQLLAEQDTGSGSGAADQGGQATDGRPSPVLVVPHRGDDASVEDLPGEYQRLWQIVAAEGPVACKRVCVKLGLAPEPRHIEGVRVKLKRLVARGWLIEPAPGRFAPRS